MKKIIVNTKEYNWKKSTITYEEVVGLAGRNPLNTNYTITYSQKNKDQKINGFLKPNGKLFNKCWKIKR